MSSYIDIIRVSGAGTAAVNGDYLRDGVFSGKPKYVNGLFETYWTGTAWIIEFDGGDPIYSSTEDVATPDLVATWAVGTAGDAPAPTVTRVYSTAITKDDGDWSIAKPDGNYTVEEPFFEVGDAAHKVITWPHVQAAEFRAALALDTPHPFIPDAYLVNEFGFQDIGGGIDRWFREYATIPASRIEFTGTEVFKFPGLPAGTASGATITVNSITGVSNGIRLNVTDAGTIEAGDKVRISVRTSQSGSLFLQSGTYQVLTGSTSTGIIVANFPRGSTFVSGSLFEVDVSRAPFSQITPTLTRLEYFLPGITADIDDPEDIDAAQPFRPIVESTGAETEFLTAFTSPSAALYRAFIVDRQFLVISSKVERYKGNIYVRETKYVRAV